MATTMTEIPIKDLALTTAPAGKQLLVRDASAGLQRIDYAQIAKNLVESYGSSSLAGKNQSIKAAIDSLNSGLTQCNTNITTINNSLSKNFIIRKTYSVPVSNVSQIDRKELKYFTQSIANTVIEGYNIIGAIVEYQSGALCFVNIDNYFGNQQFISPKGENLTALTLCVQFVKSEYITF